MIKCPVCNSENADTSKFCNECGYSFSGSQTGQLNPDTILENRYIIVKTLGRGGMGAVYMALDTRLNNIPVAIKEMSTRAVGGDLQAAIGSFKKEAALLINLHHHALPRMNDFFARGEDRWYLVMDYIEGQTLKDIASRRGPIPEAEVLDWAYQLCDILDYLHKQTPAVIFRDLKPANIMLTPGGEIKLIDFGIARHFRAGSSADTAAYGSSGFAPPEQYGENQTDPRSDIYALGATLHFLLTGQDPQKNPFLFESPSNFARVSPRFEAIIMKALELKTSDRHQDIGQIQNILAELNPKTVQMTKGEGKESKGEQQRTASNVQTAPLQGITRSNKAEAAAMAAEPMTNRLGLDDTRPVHQSRGYQPNTGSTGGITPGLVSRPNRVFEKVIKVASLIAGILIILIVVPPLYGNIKYAHQPKLQLVKAGDKWGFSNLAGEEIIKPRFDNPPAFCEGLAAVEVDGKWGFIDTSGDYVVEPQYDQVSYFIDGQAAVKMGDQWTMIDKGGKTE